MCYTDFADIKNLHRPITGKILSSQILLFTGDLSIKHVLAAILISEICNIKYLKYALLH